MTDNTTKTVQYNEDSIRSLDWREHIRLRPGMYIGKLGDGSAPDDGIYVLLKEVVDNCIDEHVMGNGKVIDIKVTDHRVEIRDFGRGIPLGKVVEVVSKINTGGKYDSGAFQKSVGLNGVGTKAVNALSSYFKVQSYREGRSVWAEFERGILTNTGEEIANERNGTLVSFEPDDTVFKNFHYIPQYLENMIWNYCYLNAGLTISFNRQKFVSQNGLLDLLRNKTDADALRYPIIHLKGPDLEIALTHGNQYGEEYYSFVNGQYTTQGGTHLAAWREAIVKTIRDHFGKDYDAADIRASIISAISLRVQEPVFESQTKTKLGSINMAPDSDTTSVRSFVLDFAKPSKSESNSRSGNARSWQASKNWLTNGPKKPTSTTKNSAIVACTSPTKKERINTRQRCSLRKAIRPVAPSPSRAMCKPRPCSVCAGSLSTASA